MFGMVLGIVRAILNFVYSKPTCGEPDTRPSIVADFHYMYFAILLFWSAILVAIVVRYEGRGIGVTHDLRQCRLSTSIIIVLSIFG